MSKVIRIRITDELYYLLQRLSKSQSKSLSKFVAELLQSSIKQEMKDAQLLRQLIQKIESLSESHPQSEMHQIHYEIILSQIRQKTLAVIECLLALSSEFFFDRKKHENFEKMVREILQNF